MTSPRKLRFLDDDFLLSNDYARELYANVRDLPIIDYHNHLPPAQIATDHQFENITQAWLYGDHYKWRAMRMNGVDEAYITGEADDFAKFQKWAETVPYTLRNPLYHWTHLELQRYFDVDEPLTGDNAREVYDHCTRVLAQPSHSTQGLLQMMNVELVGTTDNPLDDLQHHTNLQDSDFSIRVVPSFRPDKFIVLPHFRADVMGILNKEWYDLTHSIGEHTSYAEFLKLLENRIDYFHARGCRVADHGLEALYGDFVTEQEAEEIYQKNMREGGGPTSDKERRGFQTRMLIDLGRMYHARGWVQQFHLGAIRDNNRRLLRQLGNDIGVDSIGDFSSVRGLSVLLNALDQTDQLPKTILYNLNPADNYAYATMLGNFADGRVAGKMQFGSGWWYNDQLDGMRAQIDTLSNVGLLSRFVGMLTDSRSFLSFPRHEYFRRLLCDIFGRDIERGLLPNDIEWTAKVCADICYHNAKNYFPFENA